MQKKQEVQNYPRCSSGAGSYSCETCMPYNVKASYALCGVYFMIYGVFSVAAMTTSNWTLIASMGAGLMMSLLLLMQLRKALVLHIARKSGVLFANPCTPIETRVEQYYLGEMTVDEAEILTAYVEENYVEWFDLQNEKVDFDTQFDIVMGTVTDIDKAKSGEQQCLEVEYCGRNGYAGMLMHTWDGKRYEKGDSVYLVVYNPEYDVNGKRASVRIRVIDMQALRESRWSADIIKRP